MSEKEREKLRRSLKIARSVRGDEIYTKPAQVFNSASITFSLKFV